MAFSEDLQKRVLKVLPDGHNLQQKKMFGGWALLLNGNMCLGIIGDRLMVRVGPDSWQQDLEQPHVKPMDFTGRSMIGYVFVEPSGISTLPQLEEWVNKGIRFAAGLPPK